MPKCPNGHRNPADQQLCEVCDALIVPTEKRSLSRRTWWAIIAASVVAAVVLATVLGVVVTHRAGPEISSAPTNAESTAMQQWWSSAHEHFDDLQSAVNDTREALKRQDEAMLQSSCQDMRDAGTVDLRAHLPTPNADLTAEIEAAINDAHEAAHMCLAAASGSLNNFAGEFAANLDQAEKHLESALGIVNTKLLTA
jgi:uncharacterized membrane protein YdfJ with MMPL/SSD domain